MSATYELARTRETPSTLEHLANIPEAKLPEVLTQRVRLLEETNRAYRIAQEKEATAKRKVDAAIMNADRLIDNARSAGGHTARTKKILWHEYSSTSDKVEALEMNLRELIDSGIENAQAQKQLTQVLSAFADSQTALLNVQKSQMAYQAQVADATKFLYGLSAYNMASSQSVLIKLQAVLSGASKEKLGELAQQQLMLALDQLKNQESIIIRMRENKNSIGKLEETMRAHNITITDISVETTEHAKKLATHEQLLEEAAEADEEQDKLIAENRRLLDEAAKADEVQDAIIASHEQAISDVIEADAEQDRLIAENRRLLDEVAKADEEQDAIIASHDQAITEAIEADAEQDKLIAENRRLLDEAAKADEEQDAIIASHDQAINEAIEADEEQDKLIAEHSRLLNEAAKCNKRHSEQIATINNAIAEATEAGREQDKLIKQLMMVYKKQHSFIKSQADDIQSLMAKNTALEQELLTKCSKKQFTMASVLSIIALLLAIANFFV